ncbi:alpha-E domain-containing protein [Zoogloea sp.]|uniref:alpha-E domain-containing protein n=1 Tax=Zoogloea sp. TaxID=49181 RepID=UPI0026199E0C|nr:alpha-E domain-containing protein [Zoogloea sp.]MDD3354966.1 alpha-E domain-containing protein [Zoogloea sp.]
MLSRTADHLFWMARYMERAENTARILDVTYRLSLLPQNGEETESMWAGMLKIMELQDAFLIKHPAFTTEAVLEFMILDRDNPGSILRCLRATRENAHAVRGTLTSELWETSNATWLKIRGFTMTKIMENGPGDFFEWVKYRSHLSRGVTIGTMLQDEALRFIRLGTFLERADNTARILEVKYLNLLPGSHGDAHMADYYQWSALLQSVSAFEVYRKVYRDQMTPLRVAELLILRADMPRSLARSMKEVYSNLTWVSNARSAETERMAGELEAHLRLGDIESIFEGGLRSYLEDFRERIFDLGCRVSDDFLIPISA